METKILNELKILISVELKRFFGDKNVRVRFPPLENQRLKNFEFNKNFDIEAIDKVYHFNSYRCPVDPFILCARFNTPDNDNAIYVEMNAYFLQDVLLYRVFMSQNYNLVRAVSVMDYPNNNDDGGNNAKHETLEDQFRYTWERFGDDAFVMLKRKLEDEYENFVKAQKVYYQKLDMVLVTRIQS